MIRNSDDIGAAQAILIDEIEVGRWESEGGAVAPADDRIEEKRKPS